MKLVVVNGSPRKSGRTGIAAKYISDKYEAELIDLSNGEIPMFTGEESQYQLPQIQSLKEKIMEADGILLCSPEYHNGMSGALKNALDFLGSQQFAHKPVALLTVAGGGKGGINGLNNMRTVLRGLYANVISKQLVLDPPCFDYENDSLLDEPAGMVQQLMEELQMYMNMYTKIKQS